MNDSLISRQAAIEAVEHITSSMSGCVNTDECHGMKRMQRQAVIELVNLPSAQPEPHWIPVSERLPSVRQSVILSTKEWTGEGCYWETTEHHVIWKGYRWNATYWDDEVIAWMPLPEPYRAERRTDGKN